MGKTAVAGSPTIRLTRGFPSMATSTPDTQAPKRTSGKKKILYGLIVIAGLIAIMSLAGTYCVEDGPEVTLADVHVTLDHAANPFAIKSQLTPEQVKRRRRRAGFLRGHHPLDSRQDRGPISRIPGRVIGWRERQVEVVYPGQGGDDIRIKVFGSLTVRILTLLTCTMISLTSHPVGLSRQLALGRHSPGM